MENPEIRISTRISKSLHAKILERQQKAKKQTGMEPKFGTVVRVMLEEAAGASGRKR